MASGQPVRHKGVTIHATLRHYEPAFAERQWRISGVLAVVLGAAVLFGWYAKNATLVQIHSSFVPMQFNTALCFLLCGFGVMFLDRRPKLVVATASVTIVISILTLGEYFFGVSLGLDQLFMQHYITVETPDPGRMAPNTAMCFTITGTALVVAARSNARAVRTIGGLALMVVIIGSVALIGYLFSLKTSYGWEGYTSMAVHTACGFVALGTGLFLVAWENGLNEHGVAAITSMFGAGALIVLWHVAALHNALEDALISRSSTAILDRSLNGTVALVAVAGLLSTSAIAIVLRQLRMNAASLEHRVVNRTRELASQKYALDEHSLVAITDSSGEITYANDKFCKISQYSREELIGQNHRIVNSGFHPHEFWAKLWKTIATGNVWHGEVCNNAKDGSKYWMDTTIVPLQDVDGRITQYIAIRTNITEHKKTEDALQVAKTQADAANHAKSEFLANMSHEIRTPMTAILGFTENLIENDLSEAEKKSCVRTTQRNGENLLAIINDILDLSKIEAGKMDAKRTSCEPCAVIAEVCSLVRDHADAKGLAFNMEYEGAIPKTIQTNAVRLRQVLINLIGNAIKFTETGSVRMVTRLDNNHDEPCMQFDVIDTGRGMDKDSVSNLFQSFTQADYSTTRSFGGTGIGLSISKRLAVLLGGDITIVETEIGVGSTVRATVATGSLEGVKMLDDPLSSTAVAQNEHPQSNLKALRTDLNGLRILLVEDGPDNQRLISFILKKAGAQVTVKENGKLALDNALAERDAGKPYDVILMDMQMPVMDGYEATRMLRREGYTLPIIAITAHALHGDRERCINAGCNDFMTKPLDRPKFIKLILDYTHDQQQRPDTDLIETPLRLPLQGCRILLAEDNPTNLLLVSGILKKSGAVITAVNNGKLALDTALAARDRGSPFDIILMDIQMPIMGGDEATKLLRDDGYGETIIALTAHAMEGDREKYLEFGFDDYETKPINRAKLIENISAYFENREIIVAHG